VRLVARRDRNTAPRPVEGQWMRSLPEVDPAAAVGAGMAPADAPQDGGRSAEGLREKDAKAASKTPEAQARRPSGTAFASAFASQPFDSEGGADAAGAESMASREKEARPDEGGKPASGKALARASGGPARTSVFADFADEGGQGSKEAESCESPTRTPIDLSQAGSMMHRLMEKDRSDIDPRDVHKLLPGQLLSSASLDLNVDLLQKAIAIAAQTELQREHGSRPSSAAGKGNGQDGDDGGAQDADGAEPVSPASAPSFEAGQLVQNSPRPPSPPRARSRGARRDAASPLPPPHRMSPIPGWPSPPPHMVHHISPALGMPPLGGRAVTPTGMYMDQRLPPMPVPTSGPYAMMSTPPAVSMAGMALPWGAYPPPQMQMPKYGMPGMLPPPAHPVPLEGIPAAARPPKPVRVPMCAPMPNSGGSPPPMLHGRASLPTEVPRATTPLGVRARSATPELGGSSSPLDGKDKNARRFRSVEAALAWCHVQHSQKQVPVVPKEDVKRLVEFQLSSGKPIRAPWYRPQKDEDEEDEENEHGIMLPREVIQPQAHVEGAPASPDKPPKQAVGAMAEPPNSEQDMAAEQPMMKGSKSPVAAKAPPNRVPQCPPVRLGVIPSMQQLTSSPPAEALGQSTSPNRRSQAIADSAPAHMLPARMMTPPPAMRFSPAPPLYRSTSGPPAHMAGYTHSAKRTGAHAGSGASIGRPHSGGHGTGFFVPAGMPA